MISSVRGLAQPETDQQQQLEDAQILAQYAGEGLHQQLVVIEEDVINNGNAGL